MRLQPICQEAFLQESVSESHGLHKVFHKRVVAAVHDPLEFTDSRSSLTVSLGDVFVIACFLFLSRMSFTWLPSLETVFQSLDSFFCMSSCKILWRTFPSSICREEWKSSLLSPEVCWVFLSEITFKAMHFPSHFVLRFVTVLET